MSEMTVTDIVKEWLKGHGYDGLYDRGECGCLIEDLCPCGSEGALGCQPGYRLPGDEECAFFVGQKGDGDGQEG